MVSAQTPWAVSAVLARLELRETLMWHAVVRLNLTSSWFARKLQYVVAVPLEFYRHLKLAGALIMMYWALLSHWKVFKCMLLVLVENTAYGKGRTSPYRSIFTTIGLKFYRTCPISTIGTGHWGNPCACRSVMITLRRRSDEVHTIVPTSGPVCLETPAFVYLFWESGSSIPRFCFL